MATAAQEKGLFKKKGIDSELIIFRSGADCFQAVVADAADLSLNSPTSNAQAYKRGVKTLVVGIGSDAPLGWHLVVKAKSPVDDPRKLAGKRVGMNSAGSLSDLLGRWAAARTATAMQFVALGGGGVAPNLLSGNIDATVLYPPVTYDLIASGEIRSLLDFSKEMPKAAIDTWTTSEKILSARSTAIRSTVDALFEAVVLLQGDRDYAIELIMRNGAVSKQTAALEYENTILKLPRENKLDPALVDQYIDFARPTEPDLPHADVLVAKPAKP
ncbi:MULTISPECIES: ABC transporter substrate-binding protein [Methylobacterium]|uniref:NitT/TauT family transport system substrate-binding protein n=1 Tax=Methylobacterium radiotolerans TaxID=31998 RepID=A0ABV2NTU8_9HYPH|nr:ABC transporter substrate-binding protein [Methylobacterium sp. PvP105]MBP2498295.1 NitT/TauT family transport system substrate-binding protein [Methylobacterium sp. PvP105]MBP2505679.1 NitT/TauT family transport system substrate-binding protein [Methylobacterium sp. PvP109]